MTAFGLPLRLAFFVFAGLEMKAPRPIFREPLVAALEDFKTGVE